MHVEEWLQAIPAIWIYVIVGGVIGVESLGIPLPGEVVLVSAALLSAQHVVSPLWVGVCASAGAIVGDSIGYAIGRRGGQPLFDRLARRFPKHFGPAHIAKAQQTFDRWGMWAVFFGRFIALLRILAGPLAGALHMPYWRFLVANVLGGIAWAGGTTAVIYYLGVAADRWLKGFSWVALVVALLFGLGTTLLIKRRAGRVAATGAGPADQRSMSVTSSE
ncbi:membrane protein [Sphaerisporangium krabiense]|uniref:Membrane protein DedA with SNARE-associated domain n=1 Tax=Sphaerisporangium krabiense TaxID=763782 RepID=A0A7W8ZC76_9ACTN|nr:DedA family protein [Sphaerisporangium krabiense]MBB5631349.1 membrane protein DedA with SNARE-associated domain [Sphaerisporangium krabiense]GII60766.1 membrane protein [Sphaerisporangium krabiense]